MRYAVDAAQMKAMDEQTIHEYQVPAMVLMERAALAVVERIEQLAESETKILCVCGTGNNGGDGIAVARILAQKGYLADILLIGSEEHRTKQMMQQLQIAKKMGLSIRREIDFMEYNIIVDGIFGIGLNREITGDCVNLIHQMNEQKGRAYLIAVDIPSGVHAGNGQFLGCAVMADETVTFQKMKRGILLYPGAEAAGRVTVADVGIVMSSSGDNLEYAYYEPKDVEERLPERFRYSNKGTYGKVLVIAGSNDVTGAAYLSGYAAYRMGCGLVKIVTAASALPVLRTLLPEALTESYDGSGGEEVVKKSIQWSDAVVFGPGITCSSFANELFLMVMHWMKVYDKPLVLDADGINLLSDHVNQQTRNKEERFNYIKEMVPEKTILTPHLMELSRLSLEDVNKIPSNLIDMAEKCPYNSELIYVLKDTRTIVTSKNLRYINVSGNNGMATGGSGDVLTGMIAALLAGGLLREEAATLGVYLHGLAGDYASQELGTRSMLARDIIEALPKVFMDYDGRKL